MPTTGRSKLRNRTTFAGAGETGPSASGGGGGVCGPRAFSHAETLPESPPTMAEQKRAALVTRGARTSRRQCALKLGLNDAIMVAVRAFALCLQEFAVSLDMAVIA